MTTKFRRLAATTAFTLTLLSGAGFVLAGCSADTLSGPDIEAYSTSEGTTYAGDHNNKSEGTTYAGDHNN